MIGKTLTVVAALCFCCTSEAAGETEKTDAHGIYVPSPKLEERVVCRKETVVGSHMKRRVCRTQTLLDQQNEDAREIVRDLDLYRGCDHPQCRTGERKSLTLSAEPQLA